VLKAVGTGLTLPPAAVPTSPGRPVPRSAGWVLTPLRLPPGFAGTLASSGPVGPGGSPLVPLPLLHRPQSRRTQHELAHS
jgi:hypothetical protein